MTIADLNAAGRDAFAAAIGFAFERSPWIAEAAWSARPFRDADELHARMMAVVAAAPEDARLALIRAHPELRCGLPAPELTPASRDEQQASRLRTLASDDAAEFAALQKTYRDRFGFPFVICVRNYEPSAVLAELRRRTVRDRSEEIAAAIAEIGEIARLRVRSALA